MVDIWCPFAVRNPAAKHLWGTYAAEGNPKGVLHTTESDTFTPRSDSYFGHTSYPHFTYYPRKDGALLTYQHIPVNRSARALKTSPAVQTNRLDVVQIEIVGRASRITSMHSDALMGLRRLMEWCEDACGIPSVSCDGFHPYPPPVRLGQEPWRMSPTRWRTFAGWCGHQHVPGNVHGDPGLIPIYFLLQPPSVEGDEMFFKFDPEPVWPDGRKTFGEVNSRGIVKIHNDVSGLDGHSDWHKGDLRNTPLAPGAHIIGAAAHGGPDDGYTLYAADGGTFEFR
jgi:hypothetical protein